MNPFEIFDKMKLHQNNILDYLENEDEIEEKYQIVIDQLKDQKISDDQYQVRSIIHFLAQVANNHNREFNLYNKIKKILLNLKEEIKKYFYNFEIFNIFKYNKVILLFLIDEKLLVVDNYFISNIHKEKKENMEYFYYFSPEIKIFNEKHSEEEKTIDKLINDEFNNNRRIGENTNYICQLIREDLIEEFIIYVKKNDISLHSSIPNSIFETNLFLIQSDQKITLIEYAAFFGSIQIFKYLHFNGCELTSSLWLYSIHGNNPELIHFLEEQKVTPEDKTYEEVFIESIKCHHNDIANYLHKNYIQKQYMANEEILNSLRYYNFQFIELYHVFPNFYHLCKYDHSLLVYFLLDTTISSINERHLVRYKNHSSKKDDNCDKKYKIKNAETGIIDIDKSREYMKRRTPLIIAIEKDNIEIVKLLLTNEKIDANSPKLFNADSLAFMLFNNMKEPPLFVALKNENTEIIKLLLSSEKVDPNLLKIKNIDGTIKGQCVSLLHEAIEKGNIEIIKILLDSERVDPNIYSYVETCNRITRGITALHHAIKRKELEIIKILLDSEKVDPNIYIVEGRFTDELCLGKYAGILNPVKIETALHMAVRQGSIEIVKLLLSNKRINVNKSDCDWRKPASLINDNQEMKLLFKKFGE